MRCGGVDGRPSPSRLAAVSFHHRHFSHAWTVFQTYSIPVCSHKPLKLCCWKTSSFGLMELEEAAAAWIQPEEQPIKSDILDFFFQNSDLSGTLFYVHLHVKV